MRRLLAWLALRAVARDSNLHEQLSHGKLKGYPSYEEANQLLEGFLCAHPKLLRRELAGESYEKRQIHVYVLSAGTAQHEERAQVLITSLIHPREVASLTIVLYFIGHMLELYERGDPQATYLMETREMWIIPFVNPDGYVLNQAKHLFGDQGVRKNRRPTGCRSSTDNGVDINRNFDIKWKKDAFLPCSEEYAGSKPFSEPEAQSLKALCDDNSFRAAINFHSYGEMLTHPWNWAQSLKQSKLPSADDDAIYEEIQKVFKFSKFGPAIKTVRYFAIGESDDWMYGAKGIIAMSPEVGPEEGGFKPDVKLARGIDTKNFDRTWYLVHKAGLELSAAWKRLGDTGSWELRLHNSGLSPSLGATLSVAVAGLVARGGSDNFSALVTSPSGSLLPSRLSTSGPGEFTLSFQAPQLPRRAQSLFGILLPGAPAERGEVRVCVLEAPSSVCCCFGPSLVSSSQEVTAGAASFVLADGDGTDEMHRLCAAAASPWPGSASAATAKPPVQRRRSAMPTCPQTEHSSSGSAGAPALSLRGAPGMSAGWRIAGAGVCLVAVTLVLLLYVKGSRTLASTASDEEVRPALQKGAAASKGAGAGGEAEALPGVAPAARPRVFGSPGPL